MTQRKKENELDPNTQLEKLTFATFKHVRAFLRHVTIADHSAHPLEQMILINGKLTTNIKLLSLTKLLAYLGLAPRPVIASG